MSTTVVKIEPVQRGYRLSTTSRYADSLEDVFAFFADAGNLEALTPDYLRFRILSPLPIVMRKGTLIDYQLRIRGWPIRWQTEISQWDPPYRFVDRQLKGPYRKWVHLHEFHSEDGVTVVNDQVDYDLQCAPLVNRLFVARDLQRIFQYRAQRLAETFRPAG